MTTIKTRLKSVLEKTVGAGLVKTIYFRFEKANHFFKNQQFKKEHPTIVIPPDEWLFETFQLDYHKYYEDGNQAAIEILNWTKDYLPKEMPAILDWGCGTGRIVQHLHQHHPYLLLYGADINEEMIQWNHQNIKGVHFSFISALPPTKYHPQYFDLIYGISVFTHTPSALHKTWIEELNRIIKASGVLLVTTMGNAYTHQLLPAEKDQFELNGYIEKEFKEKKAIVPGNRNYSVYIKASNFESLIEDHFKILQFFEGNEYPEKFGGQDLWILQKK